MGFEQSRRNDYISFKRDFLNREDILDQIEVSMREHNAGEYYKLYLVYGIGGIGKTRLLQQIKDTYQNVNNIVFIAFSDEKTVLRRLLDVRNHFVFAPQFDFLFLQYWENTKNEKLSDSYVASLNRQFSRYLEKYDMTANLAGIITPYISYASDALKIGKDIWDIIKNRKLKDKYEALLEDIGVHPEKVLRLLHHALSEDICSTENESDSKPIFLFDNYRTEMLDGDVEWLREFINSFDSGVFIVTSREKINWVKDSSDLVEIIKLPSIPRAYAEEHMQKQSIDAKTIDTIIKKTDCIPVYLDIALALFFSEASVNFDTLITDHNSLVKQFLNHLTEEERKIAEILSVIETFNKTIYEHILGLNYLDCASFSYYDFSQKSIMVDNSSSENCMIHAVIAQNIEDLLPLERKQVYASQYLKVLNVRSIFEYLPHEIVPYAVSAFKMIEKYYDSDSINKEDLDYLFDITLFLMDTAWLKELYEQLKHLRPDGVLRELLKFIEGCVERQTNIPLGLDLLQSIPLEKFNHSKHKNSIICEINYLQAIVGEYREAEKNFRSFFDSLERRHSGERFYVKGSIYHADMLMLRGQFKKALITFKELEDAPFFSQNEEISQALYYEISKQTGHCYRFNMQLESALKCYRKEMYGDSEPLRVKAYRLTTECEVLCYFYPELVKEKAAEALEINKKIHNNLAKIYYALAIAELHCKSYGKAKELIKKSYDINEKTHYIAGNFFTLLAQAYVEYAQAGVISEYTVERVLQVYHRVDKIYGYLLLPIYLMSGNNNEVDKLRESYEWLDFSDTVNRYKEFLGIIHP